MKEPKRKKKERNAFWCAKGSDCDDSTQFY